jgi:hypothetical protein
MDPNGGDCSKGRGQTPEIYTSELSLELQHNLCDKEFTEKRQTPNKLKPEAQWVNYKRLALAGGPMTHGV